MLRILLTVLAAMTLATACGQPTVVDGSPDSLSLLAPEGPADACSYATVDFTRTFSTIDELVRGSDEVLLGVVTHADPGPMLGPADAKSQRRTLTIAVEEAIKGDVPRSITVRTLGHDHDGESRRSGTDCPWLSVGDRAVMALVNDDDQRGASSATSFYRLTNGNVSNTGRTEPLAHEIEALTEQQLLSALRAVGP